MQTFRAGLKTAALITALFVGTSHVAPAFAEGNSIFPAGWDNNVRSRLFMRLGYVSAFTKTKSDTARDLTGPVVTRQQLADAIVLGGQISDDCASGALAANSTDCQLYSDAPTNDPSNRSYAWDLAGGGVLAALDSLGMTGLGAPTGIKAYAQKSIGTPAISLGYWLDDDHKWLVEGYVLAAPMSIKIYGDGVRDDGTPNGLNGHHIATTKLLPPLVIGSYNFGSKESIVRPYVGVGAMYAVFFDGRATPFFSEYLGGKTTITTKNAFGMGPFVGLSSPVNDDWHVNLGVGQVALRTTSRIVTSNTNFTSQSAVLLDYPQDMVGAIQLGEENWADNAGRTDFTTRVLELVKRSGTSNGSGLGTYVREQKVKITNTIVTLSVGRSF